jgi:hypothetical protein
LGGAGQVGPNTAVAAPEIVPPSSLPKISAGRGGGGGSAAAGWADSAAGGWGDSDGPNPPPAAVGAVAPTPAAAAAQPAAAAAAGGSGGAAAGGGEGAVCYLCRRKFATQEQLQKHEQASPSFRRGPRPAARDSVPWPGHPAAQLALPALPPCPLCTPAGTTPSPSHAPHMPGNRIPPAPSSASSQPQPWEACLVAAVRRPAAHVPP